ncbi:MAG: glycosyl transferase, partial [Rhodospirillales bacterium]|nr:glycosyl transferase [Rhodospirillales bacterium]
PASMMSVFHPPYREVHRDAALLLGDPRIAVFKGEGGEAERRPEKPCLVQVLEDGRVLDEEWPALLPDAPTMHDQAMDIGRLAAIWRGETEDAYATATVIGTTAVALRLLGKGRAYAEAQDVAQEMWKRR